MVASSFELNEINRRMSQLEQQMGQIQIHLMDGPITLHELIEMLQRQGTVSSQQLALDLPSDAIEEMVESVLNDLDMDRVAELVADALVEKLVTDIDRDHFVTEAIADAFTNYVEDNESFTEMLTDRIIENMRITISLDQ